jgi:hypothetical protein
VGAVAVGALVGLLLFSAAAALPLRAAQRFDREAWIADYQQLKLELERSYSHLAWLGSPEGGVDLPSLDRETSRALHRASSDDEARAIVLRFVSGFRDGHFRQTAAPAPTASDPAPPAPADFADAGTACAAFGYAPRTAVSFSAPFESLAGFTLESDGLSEAFRSGLLDAGRVRIGLVRIPRFRPQEYPTLCRRAWEDLRARGESASSDAIADAVDGIWLQALAERLERLRGEGAAVVIVDIGGNGGGNDLGDWAARLFRRSPVRSAPLLVAAGPAGVAYLDEQITSLRSAASDSADLPAATLAALSHAVEDFERRKQIALQAPCDMSWVWRERRPWGSSPCTRLVEAGFASGELAFLEAGAVDPRAAGALYWASAADSLRGTWDGPVYVLTDGGTGSAAEMFAALMRDSGVARIVGAQTYGEGCGFMSSNPPIVLAHSGLAFAVPNCVRLRADRSDEVAGVTPDLDAAPRPGEGARARAARIIDMIVVDLSR